MEKETHVASPEMKLFFEKLLGLKKESKEKSESKKGSEGLVWKEVHDRLEQIIREKQ